MEDGGQRRFSEEMTSNLMLGRERALQVEERFDGEGAGSLSPRGSEGQGPDLRAEGSTEGFPARK